MSLHVQEAATPLHLHIARALRETGHCMLEGFPADILAGLKGQLDNLPDSSFQPAGIGRQGVYQRDPRIRGDEIHWLMPGDGTLAPWFAWMEDLRLALNQELFLGLFDYECHFARYPAGAFYRKHVDAFRGHGNRVVSTVLYLNPDWRDGDGGELLLYSRDETLLERIEPRFGRLVVFLSTEFPHEVLPAKRERLSLAGWFRVR